MRKSFDLLSFTEKELLDDKNLNNHSDTSQENYLSGDLEINKNKRLRSLDDCLFNRKIKGMSTGKKSVLEKSVLYDDMYQMMKEKSNKLLSLKEEKSFSEEELDVYYNWIAEYALSRDLTNTTPGATTVAPKLKKVTNVIASKLTDILAGCKVEKVSDGQENIPNGPVIYAHTHQGLLDNFAWIPATPEHCIILHSATVKKLLVFIQLNTGLVLVSKQPEDEENRQNAKLDMIKLLLEGHSIAYFPESAWNLSPNKLHLPMSFGFLDIARKTGVPVVPVVDEFTYDSTTDKEKITKIHTRFGTPIYIYPTDDLVAKLEEYKEQISTMRWELMEEKGLFLRKDTSNYEYINYIKGNIRNLELGGIDINVERMHLWKANDDFYKFHFINDVPFYKYGGNFKEPEEVQKLKILNRIHHI